MTKQVHPGLLCGGSETRLWPFSRNSNPKKFVKLTGEESSFQTAARRLSDEGIVARSIVTAAEFRLIAIEQLAAQEIGPGEMPLSRIEVPTDSHLGEDDIIRCEGMDERGQRTMA